MPRFWAAGNMFFGTSAKVTAILSTGAPREDFTAGEIAERLSRGAIERLRFVLRLHDRAVQVDLALQASDPGAVSIRAPFTSRPATSRLWLQSDTEIVAPITALALPTTSDAFAIDAAHAFVALAVRSGGFREAEFVGDPSLSWNTTKPSDASAADKAARSATQCGASPRRGRSSSRVGQWAVAVTETAYTRIRLVGAVRRGALAKSSVPGNPDHEQPLRGAQLSSLLPRRG
jgi:hypothetical protein